MKSLEKFIKTIRTYGIKPKNPYYAKKNSFKNKYELFFQLVEGVPFNDEMVEVHISDFYVKRNSIEEYPKVAVTHRDIVNKLIDKYNNDCLSHCTFIQIKEKQLTKYYLKKKNVLNKQDKEVNVNSLIEEKHGSDRNKYCIDWVINAICDKFKECGFGTQIEAKSFLGKEHPYCEKTKYCIDNSHVATARRTINSNCEKYGFCLSSKYVFCPVSSKNSGNSGFEW